MTQGFNLPDVINMYPSDKIKMLGYNPKAQPTLPNLGTQSGYVLPNGTITSNKDILRYANEARMKSANIGLKKAGTAGGLASLVSIPTSIMMHKDALKYYNDMAKDKSLSGEQRQLANALRFKEVVNALTEGLGPIAGAGVGNVVAGKKGAMLGASLPMLLSAGVGKAFDVGLKDALDEYGIKKYKDNVYKPNETNKQASLTKKDNSTVPFTVLSDAEIGADLTPIPSVNAQSKQDINVTAPSQTGVATVQQQVQQDQDDSIARALIEMYNRQYNEMQRPQIEALKRYQRRLPLANISDALIKGGLASYAQAYDVPGLANAYNGSEHAGRLAKNYEIDQALAQIPLNAFNATNTLAGNIAVARRMGMDPAVAMADKDIQKVLTAYNTAGGRENVANIYANARIMDSYLDNMTAQAIAQGKVDVALQLQQMKNEASTRNALINAGSFGASPADIQALLSLYGYAPVGLNEQGVLKNQETKIKKDVDNNTADEQVMGSYLGKMYGR